ncbi:MAG: TlyA family RNA methyltransferase [Nitrospiraceae bacterium]|nr:TlyA family RNA methyltransferase [Nitrospiraceae bacterium]
MKKGKTKKRLDVLVYERGLAESRQKAASLILGGHVLVDGAPVTKAGTAVDDEAAIALRGGGPRYASRGALKLKGAVERFGVSFSGKTVMDVGASTGGFTDYMLQGGAARAYCVDVGYGQLHYRLREDPRVVLLEKTNIRHLEKDAVPDGIDLAAIDVSFISLKLVLPKVMEFLREGGEVLALVKPQFEVGRGEVEKGGVVRDGKKRKRAVESVEEFSKTIGLEPLGIYECEVHGQKKGNIEYFIYLRKGAGDARA